MVKSKFNIGLFYGVPKTEIDSGPSCLNSPFRRITKKVEKKGLL